MPGSSQVYAARRKLNLAAIERHPQELRPARRDQGSRTRVSQVSHLGRIAFAINQCKHRWVRLVVRAGRAIAVHTRPRERRN
jgi:hypothetical protein